MTDITSTWLDDYAVTFSNGGMSSSDSLEGNISVEGAWLVQSLEERWLGLSEQFRAFC